MFRLALFLVLITGAAVQASPVEEVILQLRASQQDLHQLRENGEVRFTSPTAESRYLRAMHRLEEAITQLGGDGGGLPGQNFRGQAVLAIRQALSSNQASQAIAMLPQFVSKDDLTLIEKVLAQLSSSNVASALQAFYLHPSTNHPGNQRGLAGSALVATLSTSYVNRALAALPAFLSESDAQFCQFAVGSLSSSNVEPALAAFFAHPPTTSPGNARGAVGTQIVQSVSSSYVAPSLRVVPGFVSASDLASIGQIIQSTSSSQLPHALQEFFGTAR